MKSILYIVLTFVAFNTSNRAIAQIKNAETIEVKVEGLCNMCKNNIEKAGSAANISTTKWDRKSKIASITFDNKKTNKNDILKKIALVGYDNAEFLAPDEVYQALPGCCKYERAAKHQVTAQDPHQNHAAHNNATAAHSQHAAVSNNSLDRVLSSYFEIKNALIADNTQQTSVKAKDLQQALATVKMEELSDKTHTLWMRTQKDMTALAGKIATAKNISQQRDSFALLSETLFPLVQESATTATIYYQHCPMYANGKGANWLSKEQAIKNPYYGSKMLTCGSTVETITKQ